MGRYEFADRAIASGLPFDTSRGSGPWNQGDRTSLRKDHVGAREGAGRPPGGPGSVPAGSESSLFASVSSRDVGSGLGRVGNRVLWWLVWVVGRRASASVLLIVSLVAVACQTPHDARTGTDRTNPRKVAEPFSEPLEEGLTPVEEHPERVLFDGRDLSEWEVGVFGYPDVFDVEDDGVIIPQSMALAGLTYAGEPPSPPYVLSVEATRVYGSDFFLGVTFPVRSSHLTLVLGGWGGNVCGLSCIDGKDASSNETRTLMSFPNGKRQTVVIEVSNERVEARVNDRVIVDQTFSDESKLSLRTEVTPNAPLGIASFATSTLLHRVAVRDE